jgi:hypothetical protein
VVSQRITLKASSLKVIQQVQEMLSSVGIRSYYTINKEHDVEFDNGTYTCKQSYDLNISADRDRFYESIGFEHEYKMLKLKAVIDSMGNSKYSFSKPKDSYEVVDVTYLGEHEVFDITVDDKDHVYWAGGLLSSNCGEQVLEHHENCTLVETFPARHNNLDEYLETLKIAYLYAKTVTLVPTHWAESNAVMSKNRRIGLSQSGIIKAFGKHGRREMLRWCDKGYEYITGLDIQYSNWLGVPKSIKRTTVKPSGSVSLVSNEPPGIHYPHAEYYIRRVRISKNSPLVKAVQDAGYHVEPVVGQEDFTVVISFPIKEDFFVRGKDQVTIWEQVSNAVAYQKYWSDNSVSITVTFKKSEEADVQHALELYEDQLKSISFLPLSEHGYIQAPYETITKEKYEEMSKDLKPIVYDEGTLDTVAPNYCDGDQCTI